MNDGKYFHREKSRQLPKAIFVFAGSMFPEFASMHQLEEQAKRSAALLSKPTKHNTLYPEATFSPDDWKNAKGGDFKSRLAATLDVLGVNAPPPAADGSFRCDPFGHYIRRAAAFRAMLEKIHPQVFDAKKMLRIPANVARGFIELDEYFHGVRSIEQILRMCDFGETKVFEYSCMPSTNQFLLHGNPRVFEELAKVMAFPFLKDS